MRMSVVKVDRRTRSFRLLLLSGEFCYFLSKTNFIYNKGSFILNKNYS